MTFCSGSVIPDTEPAVPTIVVQQVNCMGRMGAGLGKQIRERYPVVWEAYRDLCSSVPPRQLLGQAQLVPIPGSRIVVANLFGQLRYGRGVRQTDYYAFRSAVRSLVRQAPADCIFRIPWGIGCGLAGGDWEDIQAILWQELAPVLECVQIWMLPQAEQRPQEKSCGHF